ncbi:ion transporter [Latilactobacillus sakei]|uniref:ion transporter n=1 Tax=Latilactobacillus sakei TaxID=1599 RepID=UPI000C1340A3|nr:ion transporter [Latilactobacillus sakei]RXA81007.1 ion transporter [Latilactobacillus sakei]UNC20484.1 ion transporter [Latilactobacillus sakei]UNC22379.1 ion transporter [Latilactobacillus sakei]SOB38264.1 Potassium/ion channel protein [Latilactobacillus sakei]
MKLLKRFYTVTIAILAIISIVFVLLDYSNVIDLTATPYLAIDNTILTIFTIDYFVRLWLAADKRRFFKTNIFDLLAIIPLSTLFSFFRLGRLFRIAGLMKVFRFTRLVGLTGKLQRHSKKFLKQNGLLYLTYISAAVLIIASVLYALAEKATLADSFWWAIATATTVGYGDISPHTLIGRIAAIMLMSVGIGFIGTLTSYFTQDTDDKLDEILKKLDHLEQENETLKTLYREHQSKSK